MKMQEVHRPTLATAVVLVVVLFVAYHLLMGRKAKA